MKKEHQHHKATSITWQGPESLSKRKTAKWYLTIGLIFFAAIAFFLYIHAWFATVVVVVAFWLFLNYAEQRPRTITYKLDETGITIDEHTVHFSDIRSFDVEFVAGVPLIVAETTYTFAMPVMVVVKGVDFEKVFNFLVERIPLKQDFSLIRWLTHWLYY